MEADEAIEELGSTKLDIQANNMNKCRLLLNSIRNIDLSECDKFY